MGERKKGGQQLPSSERIADGGVDQRRVKVLVLYGGKSGEHEVSLRSAASVLRELDKQRYEAIPVFITKQGRWHLNSLDGWNPSSTEAPAMTDGPQVFLPPYSLNSPLNTQGLIDLEPDSPHPNGQLFDVFRGGADGALAEVDVVFPIMHGPLYEDGALQGLLELTEIPYVGCAVFANAAGMDKEMTKRLAEDAGVKTAPYLCVKKREKWQERTGTLIARVARELGFPVFVKPANMGSSVGVHKVKEPHALTAALEDAFRYDHKVLIEKAIRGRELELSVLENPIPGEPPLVSVAGEVIAHHEFYSYEAKYLDPKGAHTQIPAKLLPSELSELQETARKVYLAIDGESMMRVDFFYDEDAKIFYLNEPNTLPGFTSISMYPKMWEASGISYSELLSRLIDLALERQKRRATLCREYQGANA
jgi:D-alanine-D-alanine ligase